MPTSSTLKKIALVGNYPPRRCGIATFTSDVYQSLVSAGLHCDVISVSDSPGSYEYGPEVVLEIEQESLPGYRAAADYIESVGAQAVCIQHEFGIYGGSSGSHILTLIKELSLPVIVQLHTVLETPTDQQRFVISEMDRSVSRFVVMSQRGKKMLADIYGIAPKRISVVSHGIPETAFVDPSYYKDQFGFGDRPVILTFGLLSPNKGIENMLKAMPSIVREHPEALYVVLGATHPHIVRERGEVYRESLMTEVVDLGLEDNVLFVDKFAEMDELIAYIGACDVYVTPYLNKEQITSGTLAYAYGSGNAVVSTPYWHAEELLADERGTLVPFNDHEALAAGVSAYLSDNVHRNKVRKDAFIHGRGFVWTRTGQKLVKVFSKAISERATLRVPQLAVRMSTNVLPEPSLEHLKTLTDSTGLFQHACYKFPKFSEGYCSDDNVRGLLVLSQFGAQPTFSADAEVMARHCAAFVEYAWNPEAGGFRNFMSFDRRWLDETGSADCYGRTLWMLGTLAASCPWSDIKTWATGFYSRSLDGIVVSDSARGWANALLGIAAFLDAYPGHQASLKAGQTLVDRLMACRASSRRDDWNWFEPYLTYDNARLSQALIVAGRHFGDDVIQAGLETLSWLVVEQTSEVDQFRPIGSDGFYKRGKDRANFDQQPIEAWATVSATLAAYRHTNDGKWLAEALKAFRWFLGDNDLSLPLVDTETGACCDGLHPERINQNCGAESTLSYLGALLEMRQAMPESKALDRVVDLLGPHVN